MKPEYKRSGSQTNVVLTMLQTLISMDSVALPLLSRVIDLQGNTSGYCLNEFADRAGMFVPQQIILKCMKG